MRLLRPAAIGLIWEDWGRRRLLTVSRPEPPFELSVPGGEVEPGESPARAFVREAKEEAGVDVIGPPHYLGYGLSPTDGRLVHVFAAEDWEGTPYAREGGRWAWLTPAQLIAQAVRFRPQYLAMGLR